MAASEQTQISVVHCVAKWYFGHLAQAYLSCPNTMLNLLTKSKFDISLLFKLKYATILLLSYIVDYE